MPGPQPTPDHVKKERGTYQKYNENAAKKAEQARAQEFAKSAIRVPDELKVPPEYLDGAALEEWHNFIVPLMEFGFISYSDIPAAVYYCTVWGEFVEFMRERKAIRDEEAGAAPKPKGRKKPQDKNSARRHALGPLVFSDAIRKALNDLGFTPKTRRAVAMVVTDNKDLQEKVEKTPFGKLFYAAKRDQKPT